MVKNGTGILRRLTVAMAGISLLVLAMSCGGGDDAPGDSNATQPEPIKIQVTTLSGQLLYHPFRQAVAKGEYGKVGLDVEEVVVGSGSDAAKLFLGGQADMTVSAASHTMLGVARGQDPKLIYSLTTDSALEIVTRTSANIRPGDWSALRGGTCGATGPGSDTDLLLRAVLERNGLKPDTDVKIQYTGGVGGAVAGLQRNRLECFMAIPGMRAQVTQSGLAQRFYSLASDPVLAGAPSAAIGAQGDFLRENPDAVQRFVEVTLKETQRMYENPQEAKEIAYRLYPELPREAVAADLDSMLAESAFLRDGIQDPIKYKAKVDLYVASGELPSAPAYEDVYNNEFVSKAGR